MFDDFWSTMGGISFASLYISALRHGFLHGRWNRIPELCLLLCWVFAASKIDCVCTKSYPLATGVFELISLVIPGD